MADLLIEISGLKKSFQTDGGLVEVLKGIDLTVNDGTSISIVGPSGCGKSTLLYVIGGLDRATEGDVKIGGQDIAALDEQELARFRNQNVGFVFQEHHLLPQLSVLENVMLPALAGQEFDRNSLIQKAKQLIEQVGLGHRVDHFPNMLSGGESQRVAVARSLVLSPRVLLADEPTGSLDQENAQNISKLLLDVHKENGGVLVCVTHNMELANQFDQTLRLNQGRIQP